MKAPTDYQAKQERIRQAHEKVTAKIYQYKQEASAIVGQWTEQDHERFKDWNKLHDLEYRLLMRGRDNWNAHQHQQFITNGFAIIK